MRKKLAVVAAGVLAGAAVVYAVARGRGLPHHHHVDTTAVHAVGIDDTDVSVAFSAMLNAPELATPCETAYAAIDAAQAAAKLRGTRSLFAWVAPRPAFLAGCQALTPEEQRCMMPRYRRDHRDDCARARPDDAALKKLVVDASTPEPAPPR